ncbi:MAG: LysE family transporter [Pseudarcicella sp.]|nr:LysE family transporter [Pseudarcicella sp.]MBP6410688.1 LysE family transporter [Pseudarcicella sp.]
MITALLLGFVYGFALCFTFGPAFFKLIQTSIDHSFKKAFLLVVGIVIADIVQIFISIFGSNYLPEIPHFTDIIAVLGAVLLFYLGFKSIFSTQKELIYPTSKFGNLIYYFSNGFFLNILNPSNIIAIFTTTTYLKNAIKMDSWQIIFFFGCSIIGTFLAEVMIVKYAQKMKKTFTINFLSKLNKIAGCIFISSSFIIIYKQFFN